MKKTQFIRFILAATFLSAFFSCKKDKNLPDPGNNSSASAQIIASEQLAIPEAVAVPSNLPGGTIRVATYFADGVQKYKARPKAGDPAAFEWVFVAPDADLFDISNKKAGTHGAGPFWQVSLADSVFAEQFTPAKTAPATDAQTIDWLLLKPKTGTTPKGIFADVDYIQRIATKGGKAPTTPPLSATDTVNIRYQAIYRFTKIVP
jgi:hypothetical protein